VWDSARFTSIFLASSFSCSQTESTPAHTQVTQTVGTPFAQQKESLNRKSGFYRQSLEKQIHFLAAVSCKSFALFFKVESGFQFSSWLKFVIAHCLGCKVKVFSSA
jgi:hypothetical protein